MLKALILAVMLMAGTATAWAAASPYDGLFLRSEARGSSYELAIAQLAQARSRRPDVQAYAMTVVNDHEAYSSALQDLARSKGVSLPSGMTAANRAKLDHLSTLKGAAFDSAFIQEAQRINSIDRRDFRREASRTADPDISAFVTRFLAVEQTHEDGAKALARHAVASNMPVIKPPAAGAGMPVIQPPEGGRTPVITPPAPAAR